MAQVNVLRVLSGTALSERYNDAADQAALSSIEGTQAVRSLWPDAAAVTANLATGASTTTVNLATGAAVTTVNVGTGGGGATIINMGGDGAITRVGPNGEFASNTTGPNLTINGRQLAGVAVGVRVTVAGGAATDAGSTGGSTEFRGGGGAQDGGVAALTGGEGLAGVGGDVEIRGGVGGTTNGLVHFTQASVAQDANAATLGNTPTGVAGAQVAWMRVRIGGAVRYLPTWG